MARKRYKRRYKRPPEGVFTASIESLAHDGRGVAHIDGKTTFIHGALPAEEVTFRYGATHSQYDEASVVAVTTASADRVTPRCAHFGTCGGCVLQHLNPARQIFYKQDWLLDNLRRIGRIEPKQVLPPLTGPHWGYRYKARLGVKYVAKKAKVVVGFREREAPFVADLEHCDVLQSDIGSLLPELSKLIGQLTIYKRLPQIEVALGDQVKALNFRILDPPTEEDKAKLNAFGQQHGICVYLQPKGPATTYALWLNNPVLNYALPEFDLTLEFLPHHFTQVNLSINRAMVTQAIQLLDVQAEDKVLDLFCGLGNFTLALARKAGQVTGVEGEQSLVDWAQRNAKNNHIANVDFHAADLASDVTSSIWLQQSYQKVLLDPPRSGALEMMPHIAALKPERIVYVSCHPATLARDAGQLVHKYGYQLASAGVMDMFPHTAHVESMALFIRQ